MGNHIVYFLFRPKQTLKYTYVWVNDEGVKTQGSNCSPALFLSECGHFDGEVVEIYQLNSKGVLTDEDDEPIMCCDVIRVS